MNYLWINRSRRGSTPIGSGSKIYRSFPVRFRSRFENHDPERGVNVYLRVRIIISLYTQTRATVAPRRAFRFFIDVFDNRRKYNILVIVQTLVFRESRRWHPFRFKTNVRLPPRSFYGFRKARFLFRPSEAVWNFRGKLIGKAMRCKKKLLEN